MNIIKINFMNRKLNTVALQEKHTEAKIRKEKENKFFNRHRNTYMLCDQPCHLRQLLLDKGVLVGVAAPERGNKVVLLQGLGKSNAGVEGGGGVKRQTDITWSTESPEEAAGVTQAIVRITGPVPVDSRQ